MASITMPTQEQPVAKGKCPHCGKEMAVKLDASWYRFLSQILILVNKGL